jgi:hypothetical protein
MPFQIDGRTLCLYNSSNFSISLIIPEKFASVMRAVDVLELVPSGSWKER